MATKDAFCGELYTFKDAEALDGFVGVLRAGWVKFAARLVREATEWAVIEGEDALVEAD